MGCGVGHFLNDEAECTDAFLFLKVVVVVVVGLGVGREEECIVRRTGRRWAFGGKAWEER